ncbi:hypothetical protein EZV62_012386 [Acer yangbiense]|uniref:Endonuclease/exonuclease/phosphatase domain-containing protein n=1 Tax=Acer yangbiense TaxID=1000413 RepID=A0A5C7HVA1_9ROSI|nr:hypothetical protein EZV62_012386 [Acer yangbiense]
MRSFQVVNHRAKTCTPSCKHGRFRSHKRKRITSHKTTLRSNNEFHVGKTGSLPNTITYATFRFCLVELTLLSKIYVKSSLFPHSPPSCLKWKNRSEAVLTVLKNLDLSYVCTQHLSTHDDFYKGIMEIDGYSSIYIQRSGHKHDGCGIFYKQNSSELLLQERIEYNDLVNLIQDEVVSCDDEQSNMLAKGNEDAPKDGSSHQNNTSKNHGDLSDPRIRLKRDCVGIMAAFRLKSHFYHVIVVANTHKDWDPELADVKLAQAKYLLSRLAQFKTLVSHKFECLPSVIVAGDSNSIPNDKVYQYLVSGYSSSAQQEEILEELPIPLCSVYAFTRGEPPFTNCTPDFTDTLDYIFFSPSDSIKPVSILELPKKRLTRGCCFLIKTCQYDDRNGNGAGTRVRFWVF